MRRSSAAAWLLVLSDFVCEKDAFGMSAVSCGRHGKAKTRHWGSISHYFANWSTPLSFWREMNRVLVFVKAPCTVKKPP